MSCEHAETTTLLWLYGELDDGAEAHAAHVAGCAACSAVAAEHEQVLGAIAPVVPAIAQVEAAPSVPVAANRSLRWAIGAVLAVAAAALWVALPGHGDPAPGLVPDQVVALAAEAAEPPLYASVDAGLEAVDLELLDLSLDLETL